MSIFSGLKTEGLEEAQDRLGGFQVRETNSYLATIKAAYAGKSAGGAQNISFIFTLPDGEYNETIYITNKQGENWFLNQNDKTKKVPLPGFTTVNDICLMTTNKPLAEQDTEEKVVKIYDYDEKKELPKSVQMLVDLIGKKVHLGIVRQTVDKNVKNESTGEYQPSGEVRDENVIEKVFHDPSLVTVVEATQGISEAVFYPKWLEKNANVTRVRTAASKAGRGGANTAASNGPPQANTSGAKKTTSLFGNK